MRGRLDSRNELPATKVRRGAVLLNCWETGVLLLLVGLAAWGLHCVQCSPEFTVPNPRAHAMLPATHGLFLDEHRGELWVLRKGWGLSRLQLPELREVELAPFPHRFQQMALQPLADHVLLAVVAADRVQLAVDGRVMDLAPEVGEGAATFPLDISPRGQVVYAKADGRLHVWTPRGRGTDRPLAFDHHVVDVGTRIDRVVIDHTGESVVVLEPGARLRICGVAAGDCRGEWETGHPHCSGIAWSPYAQRLATVGTDGLLRVWNVSSGTKLWEARADALDPSAVAFSPCGRWVATGGFDQHIRIWRVVDGEQLADWTGHADTVRVLEWSTDGRVLFSSGLDGQVRHWSTAAFAGE
jgi:hypothetical protein